MLELQLVWYLNGFTQVTIREPEYTGLKLKRTRYLRCCKVTLPKALGSRFGLRVTLIGMKRRFAGENELLRIADSRPVFEPTRNPYLDIPVSLDEAEFIEDLRQGKEIKFVLDIVGVFAGGGSGYSQASLLSTNVFTKRLSLVFSIPKSVWEENVLSGLGIEALYSVTIRIPPGLRKPLAGTLRELTEAVKALEKATSESDFESVVGKARITVESLLNQFTLNLPQRPDGTTDTSFRAKVEATRDQLLSPVLGKTHAEHVASVMISLWSPFSGATHPGPPKYDRAYARFSIHQAAALLWIVSETLATPD